MKLNSYGSATMASIAALTLSNQAQAQHQEPSHIIEEIVITSALNQAKTETALPVHVLSNEALKEQASNTLGDTLKQLPGVHSTSFGVGVGQPVIRGLSGNRVTILQNSLGVTDASGVSQDHSSAVEPLLAERIEVLRGPATLLYGNGAIGGVVNIIDGRIPSKQKEEISGALEVRGNSVNEGQTAVGKIEGGIGEFAWHLDGVFRDGENSEIPGFAIDGSQLDEPPEENSYGEIENSEFEADQITVGASWLFDSGRIGFSISKLNNNYGIPPGAHEHHEEEEEEEEHDEEFIRIDMEQRRIDLQGELNFDGFFEQFSWQWANNEYQHLELEGQEIGTRFVNDGNELRLSLGHTHNNQLSGTWGLQWLDRDFSAIGEEAFIPASNISSLGLFLVERIDFNQFVVELGARFDQQKINTANNCGSDENSVSASASLLWKIDDGINIFTTLNHSERVGTVEEMLSNVDITNCGVQSDEALLVEHAATARVELGNANLETETSNNIEVGFHQYKGDFQLELNAFYNVFNDYIYLQDIGILSDGETIVSQYLQEDASFYGLEAKAIWINEFDDGGHLDITVFADSVKGELDSGDNLPRIPALRLGTEIAWSQTSWSVKLHTSTVADQNNIALNESDTDGYTRIDLYADYHWNLSDNELLMFTKLNNVTDEEIRDHTSLLKNFAPSAGRGFELGLRYSF